MMLGQSNLLISRAWIWKTTLGMVLGFLVYSLITRVVIHWPIDPLLIPEIIGITAMGPIGILQGLMLRERFKGARWWMLSTVIGWTVFWFSYAYSGGLRFILGA